MAGHEELEQALSLERFSRYVAWAEGERERALDLYGLNTRLSEALYTPLQMLEVCVRNRIHTVLSSSRHPRWFEDDGFLVGPYQPGQVAEAIRDLGREKKEPSAGRVVAALTFSFWTGMLGTIYENLWQQELKQIARTDSGRTLRRKDFSRPLTPIRLLRNRIAHHEPILEWDLANIMTRLSGSRLGFRLRQRSGPGPSIVSPASIPTARSYWPERQSQRRLEQDDQHIHARTEAPLSATGRIARRVVMARGLACLPKLFGMASCPLRQQQDATYDEDGQHSRCRKPAHGEPAVRHRLIDKVADRGPKWPRQDERRPEQHGPGHAGKVVSAGHDSEGRPEHQRTALVPEPGRIRQPIAERRAQRLREHDRGPVEHLGFGHTDGLNRHRPQR